MVLFNILKTFRVSECVMLPHITQSPIYTS